MITLKKAVCSCLAAAAVFLILLLLDTSDRWYRSSTSIAPSSTLLSAVLFLSGLGIRPTAVDYHDYNTILNQDLNLTIFSSLGAYGVRYTVASDSPFPPAGCRVEVVNSLERHGARLMTPSALESANTTLTKIKNSLANVSEGSLPSELRFLKRATLLSDTNSLLPYGALQAYYSGKSTAAVYSSLRHLPPFVRAGGDEATLDHRVILTAQYWKLGFMGDNFPSVYMRSARDVRRAALGIPRPDVIISELAGSNNTLDVRTCTNYNEVSPVNGESGAQEAFAKSTIVPVVGSRLVARFASAGAVGLDLNGQDLLNLASLCSFDTLGRTSIKDGKLQVKQSGFCGLYESQEWPIIGYAYDVGKWKGQGYGTPYHKALGTGFLRELVARFNGSTPPLSQPTSLNITLDGNQKTFPLPDLTSGPVVYFDGSHDNNIAPIAAALGLFDGPDEKTTRNAQELPHNWIFSQIAPFQGKIIFEKLSCGLPSASYVRIRANGRTLSGWCGGSKQTTMCPMKTFLDQLAFVEDDTQWNTCYASI